MTDGPNHQETAFIPETDNLAAQLRRLTLTMDNIFQQEEEAGTAPKTDRTQLKISQLGGNYPDGLLKWVADTANIGGDPAEPEYQIILPDLMNTGATDTLTIYIVPDRNPSGSISKETRDGQVQSSYPVEKVGQLNKYKTALTQKLESLTPPSGPQNPAPGNGS